MLNLPDNHLETIKRLVPFNTLSEEKLNQLLHFIRYKELNKGEFLFLQGDTASNNIYLLEGAVSLLNNGKEEDLIEAESDAAKFPLAHQIPRKFSARVAKPIKYISVDNNRLGELLETTESNDYQVEELESTEPDDWMSRLLQSRVFQHLPAANIQRILMSMEEIKIDSGEEVIHQGDSGDYFYIIHEGTAVISLEKDTDNKPTSKVLRAKIGPGDSFGEEALLSDSPRNSTVTMMTPGILLRLGKEDFIQLVTRPLAKSISYPEACQRIAEGAMFLDVRPSENYEAEHIIGSINIESRLMRREAMNLAPNRHYIIYCSGMRGQSASTAYVMTEMGFDVSVLKGGIESAPQEDLVDMSVGDENSSALVNSLLRIENNEQIEMLQRQLQEAQATIADLKQQLADLRK